MQLCCIVLMLIILVTFFQSDNELTVLLLIKDAENGFLLAILFIDCFLVNLLSINILTAHSTLVTRLANTWQDVDNGRLSVDKK